MPRLKGSGYFATAFGVVFVVTFFISTCVKLHKLCPYYAFQV